jgi:hypothetical protein
LSLLSPALSVAAAPSDPHHLRFAQAGALGRKVSDEFTVPLCRSHHRALYRSGSEYLWWENVGIDPLKVARKLWKKTRMNRPAKTADRPQRRGASRARASTTMRTTPEPPATGGAQHAASDPAIPAQNAGADHS